MTHCRAMSRAPLAMSLASLALAATALVPATAPAATNPWLEQQPLNIAHQGGED